MPIVPNAHSNASSADARYNTERGVRQVQAEILPALVAVVEATFGADAASVHLAWVHAIARANPHIAEAFLAEELRRWDVSNPAATPS